MGLSWKVLTLHDRYKISHTSVLGEGSTAVVYKGLDTRECRNVAVKLYKDKDSDPDVRALILEDFRKTVSVLKSLGASTDAERLALRRRSTTSFDATALHHHLAASIRRASTRSSRSESSASVAPTHSAASAASSAIANPILDAIDTKCCYVKLLDHSKAAGGFPGPDSQQGSLFLVLELGEESLEDRLAQYRKRGKNLSVQELRELQWALACIVWGLHAVGFVHMDIKPQNIMRFREDGLDRWKLIDLDGAVETGSDRRLEDCTFTPEYMPPELAKAWTKRLSSPGACVTMSRLMDVWSVGMCSLEAIFLQPVLRPWHTEWQKETGDDQKFYSWLANYGTEPILHGDMHDMIAGINSDMCCLLESMLAKDPEQRSSIAECLTHNWFQPERDKLVAAIRRQRLSMVANNSGETTREERRSRSKMCSVM